MTEFIVQQFVVFDETGKEVEWIDPVISIKETDDAWIVDSGFAEYEVAKFAGATMEIRSMSQIDFL